MEANACSAMTTILEAPELAEMILMQLPFPSILNAQRLSKYFYGLINGSPRLQRQLFIRPKQDHKVWLLGRAGRSILREAVRPFPGLFEDYGVDAQLLEVVTAGSEAAQSHGRPVARPVQLNPHLSSSLRSLRKHGVGREHTTDDDVLFPRLQHYVHTGASIAQIRKREAAEATEAFGRKLHLWCMYQDIQRSASDSEPFAEDWQTEDCPEPWARMLLTQPPAREVVLEVEGLSDARLVHYVEPKRFVKTIRVPEGVRFGHLVTALTDEERDAVRTFEVVNTVLFLQGVIDDPAEQSELEKLKKS